MTTITEFLNQWLDHVREQPAIPLVKVTESEEPAGSLTVVVQPSYPKSQADLGRELRALLEPFTQKQVTPEVLEQMRVALQEWADHNAVVVYPVDVIPEPCLMSLNQAAEGAVPFEVTFEFAPKT